MLRQILVGLAAGVAFLILDGVLNANPLAQRLYAAYQPIARPGVNALAGSAIDLAYGVVLAWLFTTLRASLPGRTSLAKAASFGLMVWFLRVCMRVGGEWVVTVVPVRVHAYTLAAGLAQALIVAGIIAWLLPPRTA
jgi:predicted Co/Zn/Cd cation transporter (cation efflux family)